MVVCNPLLQADCEGPYPHLLRRLLRHTDVPTPDLVRSSGAVTRQNAAGWLLRSAPVMLLRRLFQNAIETRFRCHEHAPISQRRHDLARWQASEFLAVGNSQNLRALLFAQLVRRFRSCARRAAIGSNRIVAIPYPALERTQADIQLGARWFKATASRHCFTNQLYT